MKSKLLYSIPLLLIILLIEGCVEDDRFDFPDTQNPIEYTQSLATITFLDYVYHQNPLPFEIVYPINFSYTNGIQISAADSTGLSQVAASQTSGFYIDQIAFPVLIKHNQILSSIDSEGEFMALLIAFAVPTLPDIIVDKIAQCYEIVFPIKLLVEKEETIFMDLNQLLFFISDKPEDYQPEIIFPISLIDSQGSQIIENFFQLFRASGMCKGCPLVNFDYRVSDFFRYTFTTVNHQDSTALNWFINDDLVMTDVTSFEKILPPGSYNVCLEVTTPSCQRGATYCVAVEVEDECPTLFYESSKINRTTYQFNSDFINKDSIDYHWAVLFDDQVIKEEFENVGNQDHMFTYDFLNPGSYTVCLKAELEGCEISPYCEEIVIAEDPNCLGLSFLAQRDGTNVAYNFLADFEGRFTVNYEWSVFVNGDYQGGKNYLAGTTDQTFHWEFQFGVVYQVCIAQEECSENKLCKEFSIN